MVVDREHITSLIPHRGAMIMIDNLIEVNEQFASTDFIVRDDNMFIENNLLNEAGIIENIGQTAAAGAGYYYTIYDKIPPLAFFAVIDSLKIHCFPRRGDQLITRTELVLKTLNISVISGASYCNGKLVAECKMKIVTQTD